MDAPAIPTTLRTTNEDSELKINMCSVPNLPIQ
jgi:hypothetical protein